MIDGSNKAGWIVHRRHEKVSSKVFPLPCSSVSSTCVESVYIFLESKINDICKSFII